LPQTRVSLKDQAKITRQLIALFIFMLRSRAIPGKTILRFLGFRASMFDPIFLRALVFGGARFGFSSLVEVNRINQV